ncbi:hypothetical protein [Blastococcus sp. PRF04-17]|uniref:hypothetical protein n=1 Tax=Blastococcus sp. PRF04-17 TaxID=2933797 RepID=UPI001FF6094C|nr:hypothetical protein [Blastococcus sp. PRF04-17]UOY02748.1 hypothetical protein MVA48_05115 [Blastococcus sp. PRF04-17]
MTETGESVDWAAVERRERRSGGPAFLVSAAFFAAIVLLTGRFVLREGSAAWLAVGIFLAGFALLQAVVVLRARTGPRARMLRFRYALRHRVDPGPGVRERVDVAARQLSGMRTLGWIFPLTPAALLLGARWDRPLTTVPAALVVAGATVAFVVHWRRTTAAARRWVADPPGPAREVPPPTRRERLTSGRGLLWLLVGTLVIGVGVGLVGVLVFGD